jgi:hypothetical protein
MDGFNLGIFVGLFVGILCGVLIMVLGAKAKTYTPEYECTAYDVRDGVCTVYELKEEFKR